MNFEPIQTEQCAIFVVYTFSSSIIIIIIIRYILYSVYSVVHFHNVGKQKVVNFNYTIFHCRWCPSWFYLYTYVQYNYLYRLSKYKKREIYVFTYRPYYNVYK